MAQDAGDIGKLTFKIDSSEVVKATKALEKLLALVIELEREHGIKVGAVMKAKARVG